MFNSHTTMTVTMADSIKESGAVAIHQRKPKADKVKSIPAISSLKKSGMAFEQNHLG
jgi:hypothetical protein